MANANDDVARGAETNTEDNLIGEIIARTKANEMIGSGIISDRTEVTLTLTLQSAGSWVPPVVRVSERYSDDCVQWIETGDAHRQLLELVKLWTGRKEDYFGVCPVCHSNDGYTNVGRSQWFICHEHKMRWWAGDNIFSSWQDETPDDHERHRQEIRDYQVVEPVDLYHEPKTMEDAELPF